MRCDFARYQEGGHVWGQIIFDDEEGRLAGFGIGLFRMVFAPRDRNRFIVMVRTSAQTGEMRFQDMPRSAFFHGTGACLAAMEDWIVAEFQKTHWARTLEKLG